MDGTEVKMKTGQRNIFKGFAANEAGNVAMIAALTIIPIVTIAGFAIDFQVTTTQKARVQQAIDSAVLAATKSMQDGKDKAYTLKEANDYFTGILNQANNSGLTCTKIDLIYIDNTEEMEGRASCEQKTTLSQVAGIEKLQFDVTSAATYGIGKLLLGHFIPVEAQSPDVILYHAFCHLRFLCGNNRFANCCQLFQQAGRWPQRQ